MIPELPHAVRPRPVPPDAASDHPALYFNRELSWLDFNRRVFLQALDPTLPVLERVRFLGITVSNLDEFVQKRVGGLRRQEAAHVTRRSADGRRPSELLGLVRESLRSMQATIDRAWVSHLKPLLAERAGVRVVPYASLGAEQCRLLRLHFEEHLLPDPHTLMVVDPGHPVPVHLEPQPVAGDRDAGSAARTSCTSRGLKMPDLREGAGCRCRAGPATDFVAVEEVVRDNVGELFPGHGGAPRPRVPGDAERDVHRARGGGGRGSDRDDLRGVAGTSARPGGAPRGGARHARSTCVPCCSTSSSSDAGGPDRSSTVSSGSSDCLELADVELPEHRLRALGACRARGVSGRARGTRTSRHTDIFGVLRQRRRARPPSLRVVHRVRAAVGLRGRGRSRGAGHQADALPDLRELPDRRGAPPGRRTRQAGVGHGRGEGALRRAEEHRVGASILETAGVHVTYGRHRVEDPCQGPC
jgi:hypothetical protein